MIERKYFKTDKAFEGQKQCHPKLIEIMKFVISHSEEQFKKSPVFTETKTTIEIDRALQRVSVSHQQGRAFDLRTWTYTDAELVLLNKALNEKFAIYGAWTKLETRQLVVHHDSGHGDHFHVQLDRSFAVEG